ncbi:MAG: DEAD/DEAH box helicase [Deltaproteobacteria bacterium]|jgi:ATP-dependent DNA helicase RecG|nr:DEAD/DEAH box helicase [Deltaproteobacteria bacterium]
MIPWPRHPAFTAPLSDLGELSKPSLEFLAKKNIVTCGDLLVRPPLRYQDRRKDAPLSSATEGESIFFSCVVSDIEVRTAKSGRDYMRVTVEDASPGGGRAVLMFFQGLDILMRRLDEGDELAVLGRPTIQPVFSGGRYAGTAPTFTHPDYWILGGELDMDDLTGVFPVYGTWKRLGPGQRRVAIAEILQMYGDVPPVLPEGFLEKQGLKDPTELLRILHDPPDAPGGRIPKSARDTRAYRGLALMEIMFWRIMALREKERRSLVPAARPPRTAADDLGARFVSMLPFALSAEQERVLAEIGAMMELPSPSNVLLQGEVGSGKTAVAAALLFRVAGGGRQACMVAPTELLARQHFDFLLPYAQRLGVGLELFAGPSPAARRKKALAALASGEISIAVGTQALFFPAAVFRDLALAVVDEQHRFGVKQRLALREKSPSADLVSMSATPIPRSLALAFYGEMDISAIRGTLPGRVQPEVEIFGPQDSSGAYARFAELLRAGERGFLVSPRIGEEAADPDAPKPQPGDAPPPSQRGPSVSEMQRRMEALAPDITTATVHGRLDSIMRSKVMDEFRAGNVRCLVATTIVEVGVDIPGVNVMLIEGAENMGLAQLHQLRGRIGRGGGESHLILLAHGNPTDTAMERFAALRGGADGYELAELDLKLRGPGDELGLKQSGWPAFSFAKFPRDLSRLPEAFALADSLFADRDRFSDELSEGLELQERAMAADALGI